MSADWHRPIIYQGRISNIWGQHLGSGLAATPAERPHPPITTPLAGPRAPRFSLGAMWLYRLATGWQRQNACAPVRVVCCLVGSGLAGSGLAALFCVMLALGMG